MIFSRQGEGEEGGGRRSSLATLPPQTLELQELVLPPLPLPHPRVAGAAVTGFAEKKCRRGVEYVFVVQVAWQDGRTCYVKRTYWEFLRFFRLLQPYLKSRPLLHSNGRVSIPHLEGWRIFRRYNRELAEEREEELHTFVRQLLQVDSQISSHPVVLEFFQQWPSDPVPCLGSPADLDLGIDHEDQDIFAHSNVVR